MKTIKIMTTLITIIALIIGIVNTHDLSNYRQENTNLQAQVIELQEPDTITINEDYTLIRTSDDYIYLSSLTINRDIWEGATKQTDINSVTWYEINEDGYIKVYAEGHIPPHEVHWYAAY